MDPSNGISILQGHRWIITVALALNICCDVYGLHTVITQPDATKTINITQTDLGIICTMRGSTAVVFSWNWRQPQNGQHEPAYYFEQFGGSNQAGASIVDSSYSLQWRSNVSLDDRKQASGTLYAYVTHDGQTTETNDIVLKVQWPPMSASVSPVGSINAERGNSLTLVCSSVDPGSPHGSIVWTKSNNIHTINAPSQNSITFSQVADNNNGDWRCYYKNYLGEGDPSQTVHITVTWHPGSASVSPYGSINAKRGDSLTLTCSSNDPGYPPGSVVWAKGNTIQATTSTWHNNITLNPISVDHDGCWRCYYDNYLGEGDPSQNANITVIWDVSNDTSIKIDDPNKDVREGDSVKLECDLSDKGSPEGVFTWAHNGTVKCEENSYTLTIKCVKLSDSGDWSCSAANSLSRSNAAIYRLKVTPKSVQGKPKSAQGGSAQKETTVHYVNIGSETNAGFAPNMPATPEYEDVRESATSNDQSRNKESTTYMDLDQNDVQQTRRRPAELTVYQSLT